MLSNATLIPCNDTTSGLQTLELLRDALTNFSETFYDCPEQCETLSFKLDLTGSHKNKMSIIKSSEFQSLVSNTQVMLAFEYENTFVKQEVESLFYDDSSVFSTAGGFLGLALGFSCLSTLKCLLKVIEKRPTKYDLFGQK